MLIFDHLDIKDLWYVASEKCQISQISPTIFNFIGNQKCWLSQKPLETE